MSALSLERVAYRAGGTDILQGVDLQVRDGEWHALIGPNGAGKSTIFDVISGRHRAQSGRIVFDGRELGGLPPHAIRRRGLSRAFQMSSLFDGLSVAENLRIATLGATHERGGSDTLWQRLATRVDLAGETVRLLEVIGLAAHRDRCAAALPYAQRRLLELAIAFAGTPTLVLLDEPTAGMTRDEARHTIEMLRTLARGKTLLIVEHDMSVVFELAHRISVLSQGIVIATGSPDEIRANETVHRVYAGAFDDESVRTSGYASANNASEDAVPTTSRPAHVMPAGSPSELPQTLELPQTSGSPQTSELPQTLELPQTSESPRTAESPRTSESPRPSSGDRP